MATGYKDYYAVLGVKKDASPEEIKRAYRGLAKVHHPDLHPEKGKAGAAEKFKEINEAYEVLSDPQKKAKYDQVGPDWQGAAEPGPRPQRREPAEGPWEGSAAGFSDFFEGLFGDAGRGGFGAQNAGPRRGQDIEAELPLSLEDAVSGGDKRLTLAVPALCPACGGSGRKGRSFCPACGGVGETSSAKTITVHLPQPVHEGMKVRLRGQGGAAGGKEPGDLFLRIRLLPHPLYKVSGGDLETSVTVMPWVAALGGEVAVPSLEGSIRIKLPPATRAGRTFRIAGKGLGKPGGARGDLHAVVRIDIPDKLDARLERLFREMRETAS